MTVIIKKIGSRQAATQIGERPKQTGYILASGEAPNFLEHFWQDPPLFYLFKPVYFIKIVCVFVVHLANESADFLKALIQSLRRVLVTEFFKMRAIYNTLNFLFINLIE